MNLLFRLFWLLIRSRRREPIGVLDESVVEFRVLPTDLDVNLHMNNGRYLTLMDLGRLDLTARLGLVRLVLRERWAPMVGSAMVRFRRSLQPFERYTLHTRILAWDAKWFYMEQRFERRGEVAAIAVVKGLFRGPKGNVPPAEVARRIGADPESPPIPPGIAEWQDAEARLLAATAPGREP
jgi:acyl-CoA thioesterase FadM